MPAWEYKTVGGPKIGWLWEEGLNELGADGWELVHVQDKDGPPIFYLKRPVDSPS